MADIPKEVLSILKSLEKKGFKAYLAGGCVRDLILKTTPKDWDIATSAAPQDIQEIFPDSFCNNEFGTVNVKGVEITPFRTEEKYTDKRHPDKVRWAKTIEEDLSRRDFTANTIAFAPSSEFIDPYNGQADIKNKLIRAVGRPEDRFGEDALRMMRAIRLACVLDFEIDGPTFSAVKKNAELIDVISKERIRDELVKIIMSQKASEGIEMLKQAKLLERIMPELAESYGVVQNKHHKYDCYEHALFSLKYAAKKDFKMQVRLTALLHDIGKPKTKAGRGPEATFYNHEAVGAKMAYKLLTRLRFPKKDVEKITKLIRYHLFYYNVGEVTEASVRRLVRNVGEENVEDLLQVRYSDRIGSGCPKAEPYKLRHLRYLIEKVSKDPISVKMLKVNGEDVMKILGLKPGPKIGWALDILLGDVLSDPQKNDKSFLEKRIKELGNLPDSELEENARKAKKDREKVETKEDKMTKQKYWVT